MRFSGKKLAAALLLGITVSGALQCLNVNAFADSIEVAGYGRVENGRVLHVSPHQLVFQVPGKLAQTYARNDVKKIVYEPVRIEMTEPLEPRLKKHDFVEPAGKQTENSSSFKTSDLFDSHGDERFAFPAASQSAGQQFDPAIFKTVSLFTGETSQAVYGGLMNYPGRDTFRIELPVAQQNRGQLKFNLYGLFKTDQYPEAYLSRVVFLDERAQVLATSPVVTYGGSKQKNSIQPKFFEWISGQTSEMGLSQKRPVDLIVPRGTKIIAVQASTVKPSSVHLVGFISNITFEPNYEGQDQLIRFESLETALK